MSKLTLVPNISRMLRRIKRPTAEFPLETLEIDQILALIYAGYPGLHPVSLSAALQSLLNIDDYRDLDCAYDGCGLKGFTRAEIPEYNAPIYNLEFIDSEYKYQAQQLVGKTWLFRDQTPTIISFQLDWYGMESVFNNLRIGIYTYQVDVSVQISNGCSKEDIAVHVASEEQKLTTYLGRSSEPLIWILNNAGVEHS
jgi:hypothetical protein